VTNALAHNGVVIDDQNANHILPRAGFSRHR
jgi:hypothetical protein